MPSDEDDAEEEVDEDESRSKGAPVLDFPSDQELSCVLQVSVPDPLPLTFDDGEVRIGVAGGGSVV